MTHDSQRSFGLAPFRTRLGQAFRTLTTRWIFWALMLFVLTQHLATFAVRPSDPVTAPAADEESYVLRGENLRRTECGPDDRIPADARLLNLQVAADTVLKPVSLPDLQELNLSTVPFPWQKFPAETIDEIRVENVEIPDSMLPPQLRTLRLRGAIAIPKLARFDRLREVGLEGMGFTGMPESNPLDLLTALPSLTVLSLADSRVETSWLKTLQRIPSLRKLWLQNTSLGDESVPLLIALKQVKEIRVAGSQITRSGWQSLSRARPDLKMDSESRMDGVLRQREQRRSRSMHQILMSTGFPAFVLGMMLAVHLKTLFASPRARMMPGFRAPHLVMAAALLAFVVLPPPVILWLRAGLSPVGPLGISLLIVVMFAWQSWHMSQALTIPALAIWFSLMFGAQTEFIGGVLGRWLLTPATTLPATLLLIGTVFWLAVLGLRIAAVHEEVPAYGMKMPADGFRALTARSASRESEKMAGRMIERSQFMSRSLDRWFEFSMRHLPSGKTLKRVVLYRVVHGYGLFVAIPVVCLVFALLSGLLPSTAMGQGISFFFPAFFIPQFILGGVGATWLQHGRWHASELLRPQSRLEFVRGIFQGVSLDLIWAGLWMLISQTLLIYQSRSIMGRGLEESILLLAVMTVSYLTIAASVLLFVLSYQNFWVYIISITGLFVVMAGLGAAITGLQLDRFPWVLPALAVTCGIAARLVYLKAKARWMSLEFA